MTSPLRHSEISHPTTLTPGVVPGWPYGQLDVDDLRARGWRPTAFREFVLKVHQRCNLACDYCYVYELADQTWRDRPALMSRDTWLAAARRIAEHAERHRLARVGVVLHGGEPLLAGTDRLVRLADEVRVATPTGCEVTVGMQTNGVMLDQSTLDRLVRAGISIGVSVDGAAESHDRHRRFRDGRGSHAAVDRALALLNEPPYRSSFAGLLCTVDPESDPVECYEALLGHSPPSIDVLLPHANWANPPPRPPGRCSTPYADWLIAVFDRWYGAPRQETRIRLFEEVMQLLLGGSSRSEQVGLWTILVSSRGRSVRPHSATTAWRARSIRSAARATTHTATGPVRASAVRPSTALTCKSSSGTCAAGWPTTSPDSKPGAADDRRTHDRRP